MNAGNANVVEMFDFVAHDFGGDDSLFGDGNVAGSGRDHGNDALAILHGVALQDNGAGEFAIFGAANFFLYRGKLFFAGARSQDVAAMFGQACENSRDLRRRLAFSENDLGHARAQSAMMIDLSET